jgi:hypothetical protein
MRQNINFLSKRMMIFLALSNALCVISFFWLLFITKKFNFTGFFYLTYYFVMYPALCVTIFGLYLKGMLRFKYYIVFLLGIATGFLVGSISWVLSIIITDYSGSSQILNDGVREFFDYMIFHIFISSVLTFDFLIGAVIAVLVKYLWRELDTEGRAF